MGQPDRWALPDEPGPDVTEVWDVYGRRWSRGASRNDWWNRGGEQRPWQRLLVNEGPLTRHPPEANHG